ncbi:uncharacterized protein LOC117173536 [Belonocnema kinseyi]|uniref:uncharacterized protein LOC117173536 n=1 Tax=Belonocnema kinseyi TaxID=2817044 RepID=UPI00143D8C08|nr:uncharacterized protein LOC117173536 [Belonocnema kinseyi]
MCEKCQKPHNVLLYFERETPANSNLSGPYTSTTLASLPIQPASQVLLGTAIVDIHNAKGQYQSCRALLDSCSQCNAMTEKLANLLGIEKKRVDIRLKGVQNLHSNVKYVTSAKIKSRQTDIEIVLSCLVFKEISEPMPSLPLDKKLFQLPENIILADPDFDKPAEIELLIGAEFFYQLLCSGQIRVKGQSAVFQETRLGWILAGRLSSDLFSKSFQSTCNLIKFQELPILWELGNESISNIRSKEELACEEYYKSTIRREVSGRYCVKLPFNDKRDTLGNSRNTALQRFHALERRFEKDPALKEQYTACIQGYFKESHIKSISSNEPNNQGYYLPHHAVVKTCSLTTKTRVVFDDSAKTTTGISLNDSLMVGPIIQEDLFSIITRFRTFQYALTADIE